MIRVVHTGGERFVLTGNCCTMPASIFSRCCQGIRCPHAYLSQRSEILVFGDVYAEKEGGTLSSAHTAVEE